MNIVRQTNWLRTTGFVVALFIITFGSWSSAAGQDRDTNRSSGLKLEVYTADENSFGVTSTLIYGKSEAILIDAQYHVSQAEKLAKKIIDMHRKLTAIILTHPDEDHYLGTTVIRNIFLKPRSTSAPRVWKYSNALQNGSVRARKNITRQKHRTLCLCPRCYPRPTSW